ncbi:MAG: hypothetical protein RR252_01965 [Longicatena sp.]
MKNIIQKYKNVGGVVIVICIIIGSMAYLINQNKPVIVLKQDEFSVEYGEPISMDAKTYLQKTDEEILKETKVHLKLNKTLPTQIGTYKGTIEYKKEKLNLTIHVKDTKAPTFVDFKEIIKIQVNTKNVDLTQYFKAIDASETKITVESRDKMNTFDITKEGSYKVIVTASDKYKNKVTKDATIEVLKGTKDLTKTKEGTIPINEQTKKEQEATLPKTPRIDVPSNNKVIEKQESTTVPVTPKPTPACDPNAYFSEEDAKLVATVGIWKTNEEAYNAGIQMWNDGSVEYGREFSAIPVFNACQDVVGYTIYWV